MENRVGFVEAFKLFWTNYVNFKGRSTRAEYWYMALWSIIIMLPMTIISFIGLFIMVAGGNSQSNAMIGLGGFIYFGCLIVMILFALATIIPSIALLFRRFHDTGRSAKIYIYFLIFALIGYIISIILLSLADHANWPLIVFVLYIIIYFAFAIYFFVITLLPSEPRDNKYGPLQKRTSRKAGEQYWNHE